MEIAITILSLVATGILGYFAKRVASNMTMEAIKKEALQALLEGMAKVQNEFVREAKKAAEDGKLSKEEIQQFEKMALDHALEVVKGPAKDLLLSWSKEKVSSLIKQMLKK